MFSIETISKYNTAYLNIIQIWVQFIFISIGLLLVSGLQKVHD